MNKVLIVDDEMIVRTTLHTIIDWGQYGFEIVKDAQNGSQAYQYLQEHPVELLITDIKMPIMDGLELIKKVKELEYPPKILVLSGYNDFELVREAFLLGACDYLLKADISEGLLIDLLHKISDMLGDRQVNSEDKMTKNTIAKKEENISKEQILADMALNRQEVKEEFFKGPFIVVQFEIDHFLSHINRFGDSLETSLIKPILNLALQIPRVQSKCMMTSLSASRYLLYYEMEGQGENMVYAHDRVTSISKQLCKVWRQYMNLPVSAGISSIGATYKDFPRCFMETNKSLSAKYVFGQNSLILYGDREGFDVEEAIAAKERYIGLNECIHYSDEMLLETLHSHLFMKLARLSLEEAKKECLYVIYHIAIIIKDINSDLWSIFDPTTNYQDKIGRLDAMKSIEIWMTNYFRFILDYMEHHYDRKQADIMERAKRFIWDNYSNPEISLKRVAEFVGLSEKYFSIRFTKETGNTFSNYLTELRLQKAKELLCKTDMKIYEISDTVGYNNVEHFTRVFKKECNSSPSAYKKGLA